MSSFARSVPVKAIRLTSDALERLLERLENETEGECDPGDERRRSRRRQEREFIAVATFQERGEEKTYAVPLRDVSEGGLAFLHRFKVPTGKRCRFSLRPIEGGRWTGTKGKVVRSRYIGEMIHEIGVEFDKPLNMSQLRQARRMQ